MRLAFWRRDREEPGKIGRIAQCNEFGHWWGEPREVTLPTQMGCYEIDATWRVRECLTCSARDQRIVESKYGFTP